MMARRMTRNNHVRCRTGEKVEECRTKALPIVIKMNDEQIEAKVREIIDELRPFLVGDGGTLDFVSYKDGIVYVSLGGACADCDFLDVTLKDGIEQMIMNEIEEVKEVRNINEEN